MKLKDSLTAQFVIDEWMRTIDAEFGNGSHVATLGRLAPTIRRLLEQPAQLEHSLIEYGYQLGSASHSLDFATQCLQMLTRVCEPDLAARLDNRAVAVLVAEGWNSGMLGRLHPVEDMLTPPPIFLQLLQQRYVRVEHSVDRISRRVVLVMVDLSDVLTTRLELERLRIEVISLVRQAWPDGQPITVGANGNIAVMVERHHSLHVAVADARRRIVTHDSLQTHHVHVWIEPLSDAEMHVRSHLESLIGPIDSQQRHPRAC